MYIVYSAKINNKYYIGFTSKSLDKRINSHFSKMQNGSTYYFHNALRKYKKVKWEIIFQTNNKATALKKEQFYIEQYNSFHPNGYNMTIGGEGTIGIKRSNSYKQKARKRMKAVANDENSAVYKHIQSQKIEIIRNDGKIYDSLSSAARDIGAVPSEIHNVLKGRNKTVKNFSFTFLNDENKNIEQKKLRKQREQQKEKERKKIKDNNGNVYNSITEAAISLGLQISNISKVLHGHRKHTEGFTFTFIKRKLK